MPSLIEQSRSNRCSTATVMVGEDLHLDVARTVDEPFDVERAVAEGRGRFAPRRLDRLLNLACVVDVAHALAAAAGRRLDEHRKADTPDRLANALIGLIVRRLARHDRHAGRRNQASRVDLRSHLRDDVSGRTDEDEPRRVAGAGKRRVFGQKSVARMDRVGARRARGVDEPRHAEVALPGRRRPDRHRAIGSGDVRRESVGVRVDRDAFDRPAPRRRG